MITGPFKSGLAPFLEEFVMSRRAANKWNASHNDSLYYFDRYCATHYPGEQTLSPGMLDWCKKRETERPRSCVSRTGGIWNFVDYLRERGLTDLNSERLRCRKETSIKPHLFSDEELQKFFTVLDEYCLRMIKRHSANHLSQILCALELSMFFRLLHSTGLRTFEARLMKRSDIDFDTGIVDVHESKGDQQHRIVLHDSTLEMLRAYDRQLERHMPQRIMLFPDINDKPRSAAWESYHFNKVWKQVSQVRARPYDFRHLYATLNISSFEGLGYEEDGRLAILSRSMGHTSVTMTSGYLHYVPMLNDKLERLSSKDFMSVLQTEKICWNEE